MGAGSVPADSVAERVPALLERLRGVHRRMVDAALIGDGFERMAELASDEVGKPVAIVIPEREIAVVWPDDPHVVPLEEIETVIAARAAGGSDPIPESVELLVPITFDHEFQGGVAMLGTGAAAPSDAGEFLHLAAMASATALALEQARELEAVREQGGAIEELLDGRADAARFAERVAGEGIDLERDYRVCAMAIAEGERPNQALTLMREIQPGAVVELVGERIYAIAPAGAIEAQDESSARAARDRLRAYGSFATTTSYRGAQEARYAVREAGLMLDAIADDPSFAAAVEHGDSGVYGLLFRVMASRPEEVESFCRDTVDPAARYDEQYSADLLPTLDAYLANDCNMNATAKAIHAHRHTVAYRLERIRELTGLDPTLTEDRERLGLGLKARRLLGRG